MRATTFLASHHLAYEQDHLRSFPQEISPHMTQFAEPLSRTNEETRRSICSPSFC